MQNENNSSDRIAEEMSKLAETITTGFRQIQEELAKLVDRTDQDGDEQ